MLRSSVVWEPRGELRCTNVRGEEWVCSSKQQEQQQQLSTQHLKKNLVLAPGGHFTNRISVTKCSAPLAFFKCEGLAHCRRCCWRIFKCALASAASKQLQCPPKALAILLLCQAMPLKPAVAAAFILATSATACRMAAARRNGRAATCMRASGAGESGMAGVK